MFALGIALGGDVVAAIGSGEEMTRKTEIRCGAPSSKT
jgi:hypothetical protein